MSNRPTDDNELFGMDDFENFEEPGLRDEEIEAPVNGGAGPRNIRFLFLAALLVAVILIGVALIIILAIQQGEINRIRAMTVAAIETANKQVADALTLTNIAKSFTPTPSSTPTPTFTFTPSDTPTNTPTETPSPTITLTPTETVDLTGTSAAMTQTALITTLTLQPLEQTQTAFALQQTYIAQTLTAAAIISQPTNTPEPFETVEGSPSPSATPGTPETPTGTAVAVIIVTVTPSATALADTGIAEDLGLVSADGTPSLALAGLAALGLVAVIVIARRLRMKA